MYKDKGKRTEASKERMRKHRAQGVTEGVTKQGVTGQGVTKNGEAVTKELEGIPDIIDKLTDPVWRARLEAICLSFNQSHHPDYKEAVWLGDVNLAKVCELVECTR